MFSFRTTPLQDQPDKCLQQGRVGVFCTQPAYDPSSGLTTADIFRARGNLSVVFSPCGAEFDSRCGRVEFSQEDLEGLDAIVVDVQDAGARYFGFTRDVMRLLSVRARMQDGPSVYVVDHFNPAGRFVEGSAPAVESDVWTAKVPHRHGLTIAEMCNYYAGEIDARFPLHVISALASSANRIFQPWTIPPAPDMPGLFTPLLYGGGALWNYTAINPGTGTPRPYEYIGAPFVRNSNCPPCPPEAVMRPCSFLPLAGRYAGEVCHGYQIILLPGGGYHSLEHVLQLMRHFSERYSAFEITPELLEKVADPVMEEYLKGNITFDIVQEHIKGEEQKWIRKAKRYCLYEDPPVRMK